MAGGGVAGAAGVLAAWMTVLAGRGGGVVPGVAVVDGAAVTALSEGRDVRATATTYLTSLISMTSAKGPHAHHAPQRLTVLVPGSS